MITTATIVESFRNMPDKVSLDEAVERLIILDRYERAMEDIDQKKGLPHSEVMNEMRQAITIVAIRHMVMPLGKI